MKQDQVERNVSSSHSRERRLLGFATSLILASSLILAPSSAWFAHADSVATTIPSWHLAGNKGTNPSTNFLGTADNQPLVIRTNNVEALRILAGSGTTGGNVGIGTSSPSFPLDVHGDVNTSTKYDLGGTTILQTPGGLSAANTATGAFALAGNNVNGGNTADGYEALAANATGYNNTASGSNALFFNTTGNENTASGSIALFANTTGNSNTAIGFSALGFNTTGTYNTGVGYQTGGLGPAGENITGSNNTFLGANAGPGTPTPLTNATAIGANAAVSASNAVVLGGTGPF